MGRGWGGCPGSGRLTLAPACPSVTGAYTGRHRHRRTGPSPIRARADTWCAPSPVGGRASGGTGGGRQRTRSCRHTPGRSAEPRRVRRPTPSVDSTVYHSDTGRIFTGVCVTRHPRTSRPPSFPTPSRTPPLSPAPTCRTRVFRVPVEFGVPGTQGRYTPRAFRPDSHRVVANL